MHDSRNVKQRIDSCMPMDMRSSLMLLIQFQYLQRLSVLKMHNAKLPRTQGIFLKVAFQDADTLYLLSDRYNAKVLSIFLTLFPTDLIFGTVNGWKIMNNFQLDNCAKRPHCCHTMATLNMFIFLTATPTPATIKREGTVPFP